MRRGQFRVLQDEQQDDVSRTVQNSPGFLSQLSNLMLPPGIKTPPTDCLFWTTPDITGETAPMRRAVKAIERMMGIGKKL